MTKTTPALYSLNRGEIGKHALGRIDVDELKLAAQTQVNWLPLAVGPMMLRPGLGFLEEVDTDSDLPGRLIPSVFGAGDTALLFLGHNLLQFVVDDELLTAPSVSTTVTNGDFNSGTGWTLTADTGAGATISGGNLELHGIAVGSTAFATREVTVAAPDQNVVHRLRIEVTIGPVTFQVGSTSGAEDYVARTILDTGTHSIAFTPTSNFWPRLSVQNSQVRGVASIQVESSGTVTIITPWDDVDLPLLRYDQSGDIVYVTHAGYQPRKIERRDNNSWSLTNFEQTGGPYTAKPEFMNGSLIQVSGLTGTTPAIDSEREFFTSDHIESLIALIAPGYRLTTILARQTTFTPAIRISGVTAEDREFSWDISGTWVGTITLQRSVVGPDTGFVDLATPAPQTSNGSTTVDDSTDFENVTVWYRAGFKSGEYTSGSATVALNYNGGEGNRGEGRIRIVSDATTVAVTVLSTMQEALGTTDWEIGDWSDEKGWPSCCKFHEGRLFFAGRDKVWGSISDDYENFDVTFEGEAGPINRSFGFGPFNRVNDLMSLSRLIAFREMSETSIRSSNFDVPLTPTDFTAKDCSTQGSYPLAPVKVDTRGIFVEKSGRRVMELAYSVEKQDYDIRDLTRFNADIGEEGFVDIAVQRQPDTRIHFVRGDGQVAILCYDHVEGIEAWWRLETDGEVESVCVLPGDQEDDVYYIVKRSIDGSDVRYLEKLAHQSDCIGGTLNHQADSFLSVSQASSTTITGLDHLEGETVVVWANGKDLGEYTVASGQITGVTEAVTTAIVGLPYTAQFQSAKLAYGALRGTALFQKKRAIQVGLMLTDTHYQGVRFGQDFDNLKNLPLVEDGKATPADTVWSEFDAPMIPLSGNWQTDARLCLEAEAPRPACVVACAVMLDTNEK